MKAADIQSVISSDNKLNNLKLGVAREHPQGYFYCFVSYIFIVSSHTLGETLLYHKTKKVMVQVLQASTSDRRQRSSADYFLRYSSTLRHKKD
jgi:hypothetical protein